MRVLIGGSFALFVLLGGCRSPQPPAVVTPIADVGASEDVPTTVIDLSGMFGDVDSNYYPFGFWT